MPDPSTLFRAIPSTDKSLDALARALDGRQDEDAKAILDAPHALLREAVSAYWDNMRLRVRKGLVTDPVFLSLETRLSHLIRHVARYIAPRLQKVINATGVVIHTNSGRSTLAPEARQALELAEKWEKDGVEEVKAALEAEGETVYEIGRIVSTPGKNEVIMNGRVFCSVCLIRERGERVWVSWTIPGR